MRTAPPGWKDVLGHGSHQPDDPFWDWQHWTRLPTCAQSNFWPSEWESWQRHARWLADTRAAGHTAALLELDVDDPHWKLITTAPPLIRPLFPAAAVPRPLLRSSITINFPWPDDPGSLFELATAVYDTVAALSDRRRRRPSAHRRGGTATTRLLPTQALRVRAGLLDGDVDYSTGSHLITERTGLLQAEPVTVLRASQVAGGGFWSERGLHERVLPAQTGGALTLAALTAFNDFADRFDAWDWRDVCWHVRDRFRQHLPEAEGRLALVTDRPDLELLAVLPFDERATHDRLAQLAAQLAGEKIYAEKPDRGFWTKILDPGELRIVTRQQRITADGDPSELLSRLARAST